MDDYYEGQGAIYMNRITMSDEQLLELHKTKSIPEIADFFKVTYTAVRNRFIKSKIPITKVDRTTIIMPKTHVYNENYFEKIDSQEKAYWFGFIMADGCLIQKTLTKPCLTLKISLKSTDAPHLQKFINHLDGDLNVVYGRSPGNNFISEGKKISIRPTDFCSVDVNSKKICNDLISHGLTRRKTLNESVPLIDRSFIKHFIRGYFDGDGCFSIKTPSNRKNSYASVFIASGERIIDFIIKEVDLALDIKMGKSKQGKIHKCYIQRKEHVIAFMDWLYEDATIYLDRKKQSYDNYRFKI